MPVQVSTQSRFRSVSSSSRNPLGVLNGDNRDSDAPSMSSSNNGGVMGSFSKRRASNDSRKSDGGGAHRWLFNALKHRSVSSPSHLGGGSSFGNGGKKATAGAADQLPVSLSSSLKDISLGPQVYDNNGPVVCIPAGYGSEGTLAPAEALPGYGKNEGAGLYLHANSSKKTLDVFKAKPLYPNNNEINNANHLLVVSQGAGSTRGKPSVVSTAHGAAVSSAATGSSSSSAPKSDRIVCFDGIPSEVGLNSILSQVCGGALERVVTVPEDSSNPRIVQLHFFQAQDAAAFFEYTMSGRFLINGAAYRPRWGNASLAAVYSFPKIVFDEMVYSNARRCICLTMRHRDVATAAAVAQAQARATDPSKGAANGDGANTTAIASTSRVRPMISSRNVAMDVSLDTIHRDFSRFGPILSITPLIFNHVNISIQFADTRHAIRAKKSFERKSDAALGMRYSGWAVSYGKDPTDRRVPVPL